ncbi:MAG TPA: glycoside hydrolase family 3 C-terminal domain-containing protein [Anaerolineae bacterium]|nr:glycoside hydrolase family 3 C-terminal domain-containing protein [Anaerolineae bacterium]HQI85532.1 glycoside hydrolase family 3 C-terminal domain-containing protein [Anaerolineae bacterium]
MKPINAPQDAIYPDPTQPIAARVADLISRMTLPEKVSQMLHGAPAIERLGVPAYNWWNECLHGIGRAGIATVFPQAIGMAATWDTALLRQVATAISDEARAKHHAALGADGSAEQYYGLTFWTPNINIFRDPRWGRGQETYGEDPYLTARMGVTLIKGLQGDDPKYLKVAATAKHYAVHSGPENERHHFDARVDERDLRETYLPAFEAAVREAKVAAVMGAYNRTNGEPCCASPTLLQKILREEWGFGGPDGVEGHVVSDCWAIKDIWAHHQMVETPAEAAALAVKTGCDLNCGETYAKLLIALEQGLIDEATIDGALTRLFTLRFTLGMFDPPEMVPYAQIPIEVNDCEAHRALARQVARESIVLLKNAAGFLPLDKAKLKTIAVIGPNADDELVLLGNYFGWPSRSVTPLQGIRAAVGDGVNVLYAPGCDVRDDDTTGFAEAVAAAQQADVVIAVMGLSQLVEGEEGQEEGVKGGRRSTGDRDDLALPGVQDALLQAVAAAGKPLVVVLLNGSAVAVNWAAEHAAAIVEAWYPGEEGGAALADVLFGDYNPGGRLPVTFYKSVDDLPPFRDYRMAAGHTYRYFKGEPLYPFGYGLSYTTFAYSDLTLSAETISAGESLTVSVKVTNTGDRAGDEVVQLYVRDVEASVPVPLRQLQGFTRIHLEPGVQQTVTFTLAPRQMSLIDDAGRRVIEPGVFEVAVGGGQPGTAAAVVTARFTVAG